MDFVHPQQDKTSFLFFSDKSSKSPEVPNQGSAMPKPPVLVEQTLKSPLIPNPTLHKPNPMIVPSLK